MIVIIRFLAIGVVLFHGSNVAGIMVYVGFRNLLQIRQMTWQALIVGEHTL